VGILVFVGVEVGVGVGVISGVEVGVGVVFAFISEFKPHPTKPGRSNNESNKIPTSKKTFFLFILVSFSGLLYRLTSVQADHITAFKRIHIKPQT
jgi:hypothetical protein